MSEAGDVSFNLKAVINKEKTRVLFAEVNNDFLDLLFSFLTLPLGYIMQAMEKHYGDKKIRVIGSLNTLYSSLSNLVSIRFQLYGIKQFMFKAESAYAFPFTTQKFTNYLSNVFAYLSLCKAYFMVPRVFIDNNISYIICDHLRIVPNGNDGIKHTLNSVGVDLSYLDGAETRNVTFGLNQIMDFLTSLLISQQPLTDAILGCATVKSATGISLREAISYSTKKYNLRVVLQKSTKKLLFAEAGNDFVSFLSTILTTPLGLVDLHLGGNTCLNKVHNLYQSLVYCVDRKYFRNKYSNCSLMKIDSFSYHHINGSVTDILNNQGSRMYTVMDDLTVRPLWVPSTIYILNHMIISTSDIEEVDLHIGSEEAYNIFEASLASTNALSDGLINSLLKIKQEH